MIKLPSGREIGIEKEIFIIAEVGSNWKTLEDCLYSIRVAKVCGADAVKFQAYSCAALYGPSTTEIKGQLPIHWLPQLKEQADQVGIEFMCSAFSPELIEAVNPFVHMHKVASAEMNHVRMLQKLETIGKPVILSTGASGPEDIKYSLMTLDKTPTILLYCIASYPARYVNFGKMKLLKSLFKRDVGFSDHTTDINIIPATAADFGACVIEKHVNFTEHKDTPDAPHSLNQPEFMAMVKSLREPLFRTLDEISPPVQEERDMYLKYNRRLIATTTIKIGDVLEENKNFGIYRSLQEDTHAYNPFAIGHVIGKRSLREIEAGKGIGPGDIDL